MTDEYSSRLKEDGIRPHCGCPVGEGTITLRDMATGRAGIKPRWAHDAIGAEYTVYYGALDSPSSVGVESVITTVAK